MPIALTDKVHLKQLAIFDNKAKNLQKEYKRFVIITKKTIAN